MKSDWGVRYELSADYLTGWYFGRTRPRTKAFQEEVATLFSDLGDSDFSAPDHHGTPLQRSKVMVFAYGELNLEYSDRRTLDEGIKEAMDASLLVTN